MQSPEGAWSYDSADRSQPPGVFDIDLSGARDSATRTALDYSDPSGVWGAMSSRAAAIASREPAMASTSPTRTTSLPDGTGSGSPSRSIVSTVAPVIPRRLSAASVRSAAGLPGGTCTDSGSPSPGSTARTCSISRRRCSPSDAAICFDTERLRYAAGWTNGFLDISRTHLNSSKGSDFAWVDGQMQFATPPSVGWRTSSSEAPRIQYHGFYRFGSNITFSYAVDGTEVRDHPSAHRNDAQVQFERTLSIDPHTNQFSMLVCALDSSHFKGGANRFDSDDGSICGFVQTVTRPTDLRFETGSSNTVLLTLPPASNRAVLRITVAKGVLPPGPGSVPDLTDPESLCRPGPALWPQTLPATGRLGSSAEAYVVDTVASPELNPWHSWLRFTAFDFFSDGRAAIATWSGDVWIVSGIDGSLKELRWKRFAAGLFEALGLRIVHDTVYVTSRDRIVRLQDLNGDGEADFYESFNADAPTGESYHAFAFDLQTDSMGNFYYIRCGQRVDPDLPLQGGMLRVSPDGTKAE